MRRAVVLALLPILAACGTATSGTTSSPASAVPSQATPSIAPSIAAAQPDGFPDEAFHVTPPYITAEAGPAPEEQPLCRPTDVTAAAATRSVTDGVDGVVRMDGHNCSLSLVLGPSALLGADGNPLASKLAKDTVTVNPGRNQRPDLALAAGHALWGFSWRGSWCGPKPAYVLVPLGTSPGNDLKVPLTGAVPPCKVRSDSVFEQGNPGSDAVFGTDEAVQLAPASWAGLRASLTGETAGMALHLTNITGSAIVLQPCPDYAFVASYTFVGGDGSRSSTKTLPCDQQSPTIPAHGSATYTIPGPDLSGMGSGTPKPGSQVVAQVGIAGIPTATLSQTP